MRIAIVILNWNGKELLQQFLPSIIEHSQNANIYVADNASNDDSVDYIKSNYPEINIIQNTKNEGYAKGYNEALKQVDEEIYCLLNSDVEVTKNWLTPILLEFKTEDNTAIIQPKILNYNNLDFFEYSGAAGGFIDKYGYPFCRGRIFNAIEKDEGQYNLPTKIFWASGACLFIRKSAFKTLNGFDNSFFAHFEEIDLCWRAYNLGYETKYIGESEVFHVGGATLKNTNPKKTYLNFRNSLFTITKNANGSIFFIIFIRLILDALAGVKFLMEGKISHIIAVIRSHFSFYKNFSKLLKQRKSLPQKKNYYYRKSIVWSYFISKKKAFKSL